MEQELSESRISMMISQIQPHFLYNSLLGIKQLCDTDAKRASEALDHFSYYLRGNLYALSDTGLIPFEKELNHVKDYLYLEKLRFEDRVSVQWEINFTDFRIPPLTLQPLVENALRYGMTDQVEGGKITIRSCERKESVLISVIDNGAGFDVMASPDASRPHIGIENVKKRVEAQCGGRLEIDSRIGGGTEILIMLPRQDTTQLIDNRVVPGVQIERS